MESRRPALMLWGSVSDLHDARCAVWDSAVFCRNSSSRWVHEAVASALARTLIRSDSRPLSSVITRACEGSSMKAS